MAFSMIRGGLTLVSLLVLSACAQLPPRPALPAADAPAIERNTPLDKTLGADEAQHPGASGFRLLVDGPEAFALRLASARVAGRSLDVQTYIWHADETGMTLANALIDAADRGVRVRLLLDDMNARAKNYGFTVLDAHPNIEVRMFNPLPSRAGGLAFIGDFLNSGRRLNHRMHNKSWIADNRLAIVGGRNLGDEYFGAAEEVNFVDLDLALAGPVVREVSASFDRYWNSPASYPIALLSPEGMNADAAQTLRTALADTANRARTGVYADRLRQDGAVASLLNGDWTLTWSRDYRFVSDDPLKALKAPGIEKSNVLKILMSELDVAQRSLTIMSPYFVPGELGTAGLVTRAGAIQSVRILTNSLAANDVAAVHGGYSHYRKPLLAGGVKLWELKPLPGASGRTSLFGSHGASLHTKALSIDGARLFVGSYNLDPRSTSLNSEQGVLVGSPLLAGQFDGIFDRQTSSDRAWRVELHNGKLAWTGSATVYHRDPMASPGRRFKAWTARVLPLEAQL